MDDISAPALTSLAHGGGCGCKLDPGVLSAILGEVSALPVSGDLLVNAATRDDAAVYKVNAATALVATTDFFTPIVDDPFDFGRIAATNALSDIYAMGATPIFSLAIVGMPVKTLPHSVIRAILEGGRTVAEAAGAPIAGGHSIDAAEPIYGLVALGLVDPAKLLTNAGARDGDVLVLGKPIGIGVFSAALKRGVLAPEDYHAMIASTTRLNTPGAALAEIEGVHAATDVTGFGLLGHLTEMCRGSGLRARLDLAAIPVFESARALAKDGVYTGASQRNWDAITGQIPAPSGLDALGKTLLCDPQTSGGLLVSCSPDAVDDVLAAFRSNGHEAAAVIGRMSAGEPGIELT